MLKDAAKMLFLEAPRLNQVAALHGSNTRYAAHSKNRGPNRLL